MPACFSLFWSATQAKLAGPIVSLLEAHGQAVDPNLLALADAWRQAEAALAAQGRALPQPAGDRAACKEGEGGCICRVVQCAAQGVQPRL